MGIFINFFQEDNDEIEDFKNFLEKRRKERLENQQNYFVIEDCTIISQSELNKRVEYGENRKVFPIETIDFEMIT